MRKTDTLQLHSEWDIVKVRQTVRSWALEIGLNLVDQTKVVTASSELARNTIIYGGGGTVRLDQLEEGGRRGLRVAFEDRGPGIADLQLALQDHYSSAGGLGLGLGGAKRLSDEFEIESRVNEGTRITITKWSR